MHAATVRSPTAPFGLPDAKRIVDDAVKSYGQVDILVNNGAAFVVKGLEASVDEWQRSLGTNVIGTALVRRFASEQMKKNGCGAIVNVTSQSAFFAQHSLLPIVPQRVRSFT
jgi:NAD(P)-dependent dehydrogenase (short-subunit alcohol dehydrogenase family)